MEESFTFSSPPPMFSSEQDHVQRIINSIRKNSPSKTIYFDRFIPSRSASNFALFGIEDSCSCSCSCSPNRHLLRSALFGQIISPNIFRYRTETRQSMHSLSHHLLPLPPGTCAPNHHP